jgi:hypothetical protein
MLEIAEDKVTFSRNTWDELKSSIYFSELIEAIEDKESLMKIMEQTEYYVDYDEYKKKRLGK